MKTMHLLISFLLGAITVATMEVLLSTDNTVALAAYVHMPTVQNRRRFLELFVGLPLGFCLRALAILLAFVVFQYPVLKIVGALYLAYVSVRFFVAGGAHDQAREADGHTLLKRIVMLEVLNLSLSLDNAMVSAGLGNTFLTTLVGVCFGMLVVRFNAGIITRLLRAVPQLETLAYVMVLWVAGFMIVQLFVPLSAAVELEGFAGLGIFFVMERFYTTVAAAVAEPVRHIMLARMKREFDRVA